MNENRPHGCHMLRAVAATAAAVIVLTLSACGEKSDTTPSTQPSTQTAEEPSTQDSSNKLEGQVNGITFTQESLFNETLDSETIVVTADDDKWTFKLVDGTLPDEEVLRMRYVTLSAYGFYSTSGANRLTPRINNHDFVDCNWGDAYGSVCWWTVAFGYEDDVYYIDTDEANRCEVPIKFDDDDLTVFADFWLDEKVEQAPVNGPDEERIVTDYRDAYGSNFTREVLYAYGLDGLPCRGV